MSPQNMVGLGLCYGAGGGGGGGGRHGALVKSPSESAKHSHAP